MVDIVQSNENKLLIRKIGYSVGLESTLDRFLQIVELYVRERQLTDSAWRALVKDGFGRDPRSAKEFENVFGVLGILSISNGRPVPQNLLDAAALLSRHFEGNPGKYRIAASAILLYSLTAADGELFGALLSCNFAKAHFEQKLTEFRRDKLELFFEFYRSQFDREKLHQVIDFQEIVSMSSANRRNASREGPFAKPAIFQKKGQAVTTFEVSISDDWLKKVPARRQAWAEDLCLLANGNLTRSGEAYLAAMAALKPARSREIQSLILLPMDSELRAKHVTTALPQADLIAHADYLEAICSTFQRGPPSPHTLDLEDLARWQHENYAKADSRFQMLRRELPFTIFALVVLGICAANGQAIGRLQNDIEAKAMQDRTLLLRPSRLSTFGISFPK